MCCSPWGHKSRTRLKDWTDLNICIKSDHILYCIKGFLLLLLFSCAYKNILVNHIFLTFYIFLSFFFVWAIISFESLIKHIYYFLPVLILYVSVFFYSQCEKCQPFNIGEDNSCHYWYISVLFLSLDFHLTLFLHYFSSLFFEIINFYLFSLPSINYSSVHWKLWCPAVVF